MSFVYDIAEVPDLSQFVYDIKILYQLKGYRVKSLNDLCSTFLDQNDSEPYHRICESLRSHIRSYAECGISVRDFQIDQIIPEPILARLCEEKQKVVSKLFHRFADEHVIAFYEKFFSKLQCLHRVAKALNLKFNFAGNKTGRLSFKSNTFNPYVLPKSQRNQIKARPGYHLYQFDLRSSQPRIAIFSTCDESFKRHFSNVDDIYSVFDGDREANKISFLRWMYSSHYTADHMFGEAAKPIKTLREAIYMDALNNTVIHNRFGRPLFFSEQERMSAHLVFQRYISSTEADALYEILLDLEAVLRETQSRILFPFYDAIICEVSDDEDEVPDLIQQIIENHYANHMFFCRFPVDVKCGLNLSAVA